MREIEPILTVEDCDRALRRLLDTTLRAETLVAERDTEIGKVQGRYATRLAAAGMITSLLESEIEAAYTAHRAEWETAGKKSVQLVHGLLGMRAPSHPALIPLNKKWTWPLITAQVRELWKRKYFNPPKPRTIDKDGLKKALTVDQLKACGLKLDTDETFYYELNRLAAADPATADPAATAAA